MHDTDPINPKEMLAEIASLKAQLQSAQDAAARASHAEWQLRAILAHGGVGVLLGDLTGRFVYTNRAIQEFLGYTEAELGEIDFRAFTHPEDLPGAEAAARATVAGKLPYFVAEKRYLHKSGAVKWGKLRFCVIRDDGGTPVYSLAMVQDITQGKLAEHALAESQSKLQAIVERSADAIYVKDREGRYVLINPAGSELLGLTPADFIGRLDTDVFGEVGAKLMADDAAVMQAGTVANFEEVFDKTARGRVVFSSIKYPYRAHDGRLLGIIGISRDITQRKELELALAAQNEELKRLDRLKSTIVSAVSHEFRTPLTLIKGYAEFLAEQLLGPLTPDQEDCVGKINHSVDRLERLVSDLLDISTIEAGAFRLLPGRADLVDLVRRSVSELEPLAREADLALSLSSSPGPVMMWVDAQRIEQVVSNLVTNAVKFTPRGGRIVVTLDVDDVQARCSVEDTGIGIASDEQARVFERFTRLENGIKRGGTGLGLSISKALVEAHGGTIGVQSEPGKGSCFWFSLPLDGPLRGPVPTAGE